MVPLGLYIHIPYCEKKCHYCDFTSFPKKDKNIDLYIDNLIKELDIYKCKLTNYTIDTIFIGGGTPTSIDELYIKKVLDYVFENFNIDNLKEITLEANPGTLSIYKIKQYQSFGINRISLGVQSSKDNLLKSIGRIHNWEECESTIKLLKKVGFENINVDLMFGLPGQTLEDLENTLEKIVTLDIPHISFYSLIIEDGTLINKWYKKGLIDLPNEDLERLMYKTIVEYLKSKGYKHYEISNFAKEGFECKHNLKYWKVKPYLGVGLSSHSNLFNKRFWNYSSFETYQLSLIDNNLPIAGEEIIEPAMEIAEFCILGLRLIDGINKDEYLKRFGEDINVRYTKIIEKHIKNGLIFENSESIKLTGKGLDLSNIVEVDFMP